MMSLNSVIIPMLFAALALTLCESSRAQNRDLPSDQELEEYVRAGFETLFEQSGTSNARELGAALKEAQGIKGDFKHAPSVITLDSGLAFAAYKSSENFCNVSLSEFGQLSLTAQEEINLGGESDKKTPFDFFVDVLNDKECFDPSILAPKEQKLLEAVLAINPQLINSEGEFDTIQTKLRIYAREMILEDGRVPTDVLIKHYLGNDSRVSIERDRIASLGKVSSFADVWEVDDAISQIEMQIYEQEKPFFQCSAKRVAQKLYASREEYSPEAYAAIDLMLTVGCIDEERTQAIDSGEIESIRHARVYEKIIQDDLGLKMHLMSVGDTIKAQQYGVFHIGLGLTQVLGLGEEFESELELKGAH